MKYRLISRISNGIGNQMFIYAASFSISKKIGKNLFIDIYSGINNDRKKILNKNFKHYEPKFELGIFNISSKIASDNLCFDTFFKDLKRKLLKIVDFFFKKKKFILENKKKNKQTFFDENNYKKELNNDVFLEGNFESEKYFLEHRSDIINEFSFKNKIKCNEEYLHNIINSNSVSLCFRSDRYNERFEDDKDINKLKKTKLFEEAQYNYILRAVNYFEHNLTNPKFHLFSDNFTKLDKYFLSNKFYLIKDYINDKVVEDFLLMTSCKHYAVAPTSFHWWAAWLNQNENKICLRPKDINPSNNSDFWPESWKSI